MKSKRGSNKIYYYIDLFFILLPLLLFIGGFIIYVCNNNNGTNGTLTVSNISQFFYDYIANLVDIFFYPNTFDNIGTGTLFETFYEITGYILQLFVTYDGDPYTIYFIQYYFMYLMFYEFFSLFINIIMWLPRWCRNKVRDWTGSDCV